MPTIKKRANLYESAEGKEIIRQLQQMVEDKTLKTDAAYSANLSSYPDHSIPFVDKHVAYLNSHPKLDAEHYLSNLRIMLKIR